MALAADLRVHLDIAGPVTALRTALTTATSALDAIHPPLDADTNAGLLRATGSLNLDGLAPAAARLAAAVAPLGTLLPPAANALPALAGAIALAEQLAAPDLQARIATLLGTVEAQARPGEDGTIGLILGVLKTLRQAPEADPLRQLFARINGALGDPAASAFTGFAELIPAITGTGRAVAALANIEARLAETERLAGIAAAQLDSPGPDVPGPDVTTHLGEAGALASFITSLDPNDEAAIASAARELTTVSGHVGALATTLRDNLAFSEATLIHLDLAGLHQDLATLRATLRGADLAPLERLLAALASRLAGVFTLNLGAAPIRDLASLLDDVERMAADLAERIGARDIDALLAPITDGLNRVIGVPAILAGQLQEDVTALLARLDPVRQAIRALPVDDVAGQLRQGADAAARALAVLGDVLGAAQTQIGTLAGQANAALATVGDDLAAFRASLDTAFAAARTVLARADIDATVADIAAGIDDFLAVLDKADMAPVFHTAHGAIRAAADVVEQVPFDLLPDSMEQDVVDAIRPVKQTDTAAVRFRIETALGIVDGTFSVRATLEASVADIRVGIAALHADIGRLDPKLLAEPAAAPLAALRARVAGLRPNMELAPLRDGLNVAKQAVAAVDPIPLLQPVEQAFDTVLATIDQFSPATLLAPLEQKLDQAREQLIDLTRLREWRGHLDFLEAQAAELIALLDVSGLERDLTRALRALQVDLPNLPALGPLDAILNLLGPMLGADQGQAVFARVGAWFTDGAAAAARLGARGGQIRTHLATIADRVAAADPTAHASRLAASIAPVRAAITLHPPGPLRLRLEAAFSVDAPLAELAAMAAPWQAYRASLADITRAASGLGAEGFVEADAIARRLTSAAAPLRPAGVLIGALLRPLGIQRIDRGLAGVVEELFMVANPRRLARIVAPILTALRNRLQALIAAIIRPFRDGIDALIAALRTFDLGPLRARLQDVTDALKQEIAALRPSRILGDALAAFAAAKATVAAFDPLGAVDAALQALRQRILALLDLLDLDKLLAQPVRLFADLTATLAVLDVDVLLAPILARLDAIAAQVQAGLTATFSAFEDLQAALPDQVGGTSVTVSASVSVG